MSASSDTKDAGSTPRTRLGTGKRLAFSAITLFLVLGSIELAIRLTGVADHCNVPYKTNKRVCDPILYFRNGPKMRVLGRPLNSDGFRAREFTRKRQDVYRIVSLGDSCTIGVFADDTVTYVDQPYPDRLEALVRERTGRDAVEVFNLGVGGYNSFHGLMLLRTKVRTLDPDLVTVRYGWNDHFVSPAVRGERAFSEPRSSVALALQDVLLRTKLYSFFRRVQLDAIARARGDAKPALPRAWTPDISLGQYKHNLRRIVEVARSQGAAVWFITAPHAFLIDEYRGRYDSYAERTQGKRALRFNGISSYERFVEIHEQYTAATREVALELDVVLVDVVPIYREHSAERLFSGVDAMHPLQAGHDLEAEALYDALVAAGVVPLDRSPIDN